MKINLKELLLTLKADYNLTPGLAVLMIMIYQSDKHNALVKWTNDLFSMGFASPHQMIERLEARNIIMVGKLKDDDYHSVITHNHIREKYFTTDEQKIKDLDGTFEMMWKMARRGSKKVAYRRFEASLKRALKAGFRKHEFVAAWEDLVNNASSEKYIPHFSTWLNEDRWESFDKENYDDNKVIVL